MKIEFSAFAFIFTTLEFLAFAFIFITLEFLAFAIIFIALAFWALLAPEILAPAEGSLLQSKHFNSLCRQTLFLLHQNWT